MFRWLRNVFIAGLIIVLPIAGTIYILYAIFLFLDKILGPITTFILGRQIPGLGFVLTLLLLVVTGVIGRNYFFRKLISLSERVMIKIPFVRPVYTTVKQIINALFNQSTSKAFKKVVLVEYPRKGLYQIGFLTGSGVEEIGDKVQQEIIHVFLPTAPNPTSGMLVMIPKKDLLFLEMTVEEGIKLVLSGGVLTPKRVGNESNS